MLCSLSSSCLSEIWGGGCGGGGGTKRERGREHKSARARRETEVCRRSATASSPRPPPQGRTKCGCTGDLGPPLRRCGIRDRWPAFWTAGRALDSLLWQRADTERERCTVRSVTVGKRGGRYFSLEAVSRSDYFPICDLRQHRREGQDLLRQITKHDAGHGTSDITTECLRRQTLLVTRAWKSYSWLCRALSRRGRPSRGRGRPSWRQSTAACSSHSSWQSPSVGS